MFGRVRTTTGDPDFPFENQHSPTPLLIGHSTLQSPSFWVRGDRMSSAFSGFGLRYISVSEGNPHFKVSGPCLLDRTGLCLIHYFGAESTVTICREIEVLSEGSFRSCQSLRRLKFESESNLRSIGARAFEKCNSLRFVSLPSSTEVLGHRCFAKCRNLRQVEFGPNSRLTRIEGESFVRCGALDPILLPLSLKDKADVDLNGANGLEVGWYDDSG
jgi:hypothetical protein